MKSCTALLRACSFFLVCDALSGIWRPPKPGTLPRPVRKQLAALTNLTGIQVEEAFHKLSPSKRSKAMDSLNKLADMHKADWYPQIDPYYRMLEMRWMDPRRTSGALKNVPYKERSKVIYAFMDGVTPSVKHDKAVLAFDGLTKSWLSYMKGGSEPVELIASQAMPNPRYSAAQMIKDKDMNKTRVGAALKDLKTRGMSRRDAIDAFEDCPYTGENATALFENLADDWWMYSLMRLVSERKMNKFQTLLALMRLPVNERGRAISNFELRSGDKGPHATHEFQTFILDMLVLDDALAEKREQEKVEAIMASWND